MTLNSGDIHDNKVLQKGWRLKQARMVAGIAVFLIIYAVKKRKKHKRSWWVRPWAREQRRQAQGFADILIMELR